MDFTFKEEQLQFADALKRWIESAKSEPEELEELDAEF